MTNFILVALTFHLLAVTVVELTDNYTFGDIISFPRECAKIKGVYKHFAVYVGTDDVFGQGKDKDIFHRIRNPIKGEYCVFGSLKEQQNHIKENYLDNSMTPSIKAEIIKHILVMKTKEKCGTYNLLTNNCEHLATWVRYGKAYLRQPGTKAGYFLKLIPEKTLHDADKAVESISDGDIFQILQQLYSYSEAEDRCVKD